MRAGSARDPSSAATRPASSATAAAIAASSGGAAPSKTTARCQAPRLRLPRERRFRPAVRGRGCPPCAEGAGDAGVGAAAGGSASAPADPAVRQARPLPAGVPSLRATGRFRSPRRVAGPVGLVRQRRRAGGEGAAGVVPSGPPAPRRERRRSGPLRLALAGRGEGRVGQIDWQAVDHAREHRTQQRGWRRRRRRGLADGVEQRRGLAVRPAQHRAEKCGEFAGPRPSTARAKAAIRPPRRQQRGPGLEVARFVPRPGLAPLDPAGRHGIRSDVRRRRRPSGLGGRPRTEGWPPAGSGSGACGSGAASRAGGATAAPLAGPPGPGVWVPTPGTPGRAEVPAGQVRPCCRRGRRRGRGRRAARRVAGVARISGPRDRVDAVRIPGGRLGRQPCGRGCHGRTVMLAGSSARRASAPAIASVPPRLRAVGSVRVADAGVQAQWRCSPVATAPVGGGRRCRRRAGGGGRVRPRGGGRRGRRSGGAVCRVPRLQWVGVVAAGVARAAGGRVVGPRGGGRCGRRSGGICSGFRGSRARRVSVPASCVGRSVGSSARVAEAGVAGAAVPLFAGLHGSRVRRVSVSVPASCVSRAVGSSARVAEAGAAGAAVALFAGLHGSGGRGASLPALRGRRAVGSSVRVAEAGAAGAAVALFAGLHGSRGPGAPVPASRGSRAAGSSARVAGAGAAGAAVALFAGFRGSRVRRVSLPASRVGRAAGSSVRVAGAGVAGAAVVLLAGSHGSSGWGASVPGSCEVGGGRATRPAGSTRAGRRRSPTRRCRARRSGRPRVSRPSETSARRSPRRAARVCRPRRRR